MKGDFSNWRFNPQSNDQAVLFQQGRVTLDTDLSEAGLIELTWRTQAGRDVIGGGVAAVPAGQPEGWRIEAAVVDGDGVRVQLHPGRIWADGQLLYLPGSAYVAVDAPYLPPPHNPAGTSVADIGAGTRDAVILEFTLEELNGFQLPDRLIEPALGGPDTAERLNVRAGLGLLRLAAGEDCASIGGRLAEPPGGRLSASLTPPEETDDVCPLAAAGGYTGFEHNLYRVEIALADAGGPYFKWSRFNGGLVGRGEFLASGSQRRVVLGANRTAIVNSGFTSCYLEAVVFDPLLGHWRVSYGAFASLNGDQDLELTDPPVYGDFPATAAGESVFFRLWDGLLPLADFDDTADPVHLNDGIHLSFNSPGASYRPGDYWVFAVRAGEIANPEILLDDQMPHGPVFRRVPLAEINWNALRDSDEGAVIEDCRRRFNPLVRQKVCCTLLVGDGVRSFGDFNSLEEAAAHLPALGGRLCLLPGLHFANLALAGRSNIRVEGCAHQTWLLARPETPAEPILAFSDCNDIHVSGLDMLSFAGAAISATADDKADAHEFSVRQCRILAHTECIRVHGLRDVHLADNRAWLMDTEHGQAAISLRVRDALVERNRVGVWPWSQQPPGDGGDDDTPNPDDPCADPGQLYGNLPWVLQYVGTLWVSVLAAPPAQPYQAWGGIHLRGGCEETRLLENHVDGGAGHGVTLGGVLPGEPMSGPGGLLPTVTLTSRDMLGYVQDESGEGLAGIDVYLSRNGVVEEQTASGAAGEFNFAGIPALSYQVSVEAGYEIVEMREASLDLAAMRLTYYILVVRPASVAGNDDARLYRIAIDGNEVERMALSGIGFLPYSLKPEAPPLPSGASTLDEQVVWLSYLAAPRELIGSCNVVVDLAIRDNRLHHNLLAVFNDALRRAARDVGQGGISLALVESALIADNRIHDNGTRAVNPTCGVFVGYAEDLELRGNRISNNGPLDAEYTGGRLEGIRGGVFVRLAGAFLFGGEADAYQKPALRLADNIVDQPAGRALTAFAFGPVACDSNRFNSEREGRFGLLDALVGTVLILNLGGIHRQMQFPASDKKAGAAPASSYDNTLSYDASLAGNAWARVPVVESLLPGGEVQFNSNQTRMGPENRAFLSQLIFTLDDLGFDANQSAVFRQDVLFGNTAAFGLTVRASDSRFRERTLYCGLSLWSLGVGLTTQAKRMTMNTTAHNQGDHCIIALNQSPMLVADGNLVLVTPLCPKEGGDNAMKYILTAFVVSYLAETAPSYGDADGKEAGQVLLNSGMKSVQTTQLAARQSAKKEAARLDQTQGADSTRAQAMTQRLARNSASLAQLKLQTELAGIRETEAPASGAAVDGRVADAAGRGQAGLEVELVGADGASLGIKTRTDASGYYGFALDAATAKRLAAEKDVRVRVKDGQGQALAEDPVRVDAGASQRLAQTVATPMVPVSARALGSVIYRAPEAAALDPVKSTPLENVKGIGPKTAAKYRAAGIADMETLTRAPASKLAEVAGLDKKVVEAETAKPVAKAAGTTETKPATRAKAKGKPAGKGGGKGGGK